MGGVVNERVKDDDVVVGTVVACERVSPINVAIAIAHVHADGIGFEIIREDLVAIAINSHACGVTHVVAVVETIVAMALADFTAGAIEDCVVTISVAGRFVGNHLILAVAANEEVVFDHCVTGRKTEAAETQTDDLGAIAAKADEVVEIIVMDP